jgi:hypothetical protein
MSFFCRENVGFKNRCKKDEGDTTVQGSDTTMFSRIHAAGAQKNSIIFIWLQQFNFVFVLTGFEFISNN